MPEVGGSSLCGTRFGVTLRASRPQWLIGPFRHLEVIRDGLIVLSYLVDRLPQSLDFLGNLARPSSGEKNAHSVTFLET